MPSEGIPFNLNTARQYTVGRVVRVRNNEGLSLPVGLVGVVYATFRDESCPSIGLMSGGFAVIWEKDLGVTGFSHEQAEWWLAPTPWIDPRLAGYQFAGLGNLYRDYEQGLFAPAFALARSHLRSV
jgi:hypothetical protein